MVVVHGPLLSQMQLLTNVPEELLLCHLLLEVFHGCLLLCMLLLCQLFQLLVLKCHLLWRGCRALLLCQLFQGEAAAVWVLKLTD